MRANPTDLFAFLEPENPQIYKLYAAQISRTTDNETFNFKKVRQNGPRLFFKEWKWFCELNLSFFRYQYLGTEIGLIFES